jgi:hypothetical protein
MRIKKLLFLNSLLMVFGLISLNKFNSTFNNLIEVNAGDYEVTEDWTVTFDFTFAQSWWRDCANPEIQYINIGDKNGFVILTEVPGSSRNKWQTQIYKEALNYNGLSFLLRVCGSYGNNNQTIDYNAREQFRNPNNNYATLDNPGEGTIKTLVFSQETVSVQVKRKDSNASTLSWIDLANTTWPKYNHVFNPELIYSRIYNSSGLFSNEELTTSYTPSKLTSNLTLYTDDFLNYSLSGGDSPFIRIPVVRPVFWKAGDTTTTLQVLRVSSSKTALETNTPTISDLNQMTLYMIREFNNDSYYTPLSEGFTTNGGYATDGIVYYDLPLDLIKGKYFDLARINSVDPIFAGSNNGSVFNRTSGSSAEQFTVDGSSNPNFPSLVSRIWRIFENGLGIFRPSGISAESRVVSNETVQNLLKAYDTCSSSLYNGAGSFKDLNDHFNLVPRDYGDLFIDDLSGAEDVSIYNKVERMRIEYNSLPGTTNPILRIRTTTPENSNNFNILVYISLILMPIFLIKKSRFKNQ